MHTKARALLLGAAVIGTLDALYAIVFWNVRSGTAPGRIFQSVAAGLLGKASFDGGWRSILLGAALHYFIAFGIVFVYWMLSRRLPVLIEKPIVCGALYGLLAYGVMNYVVIPLSATRRPRFLLLWVVCSLVVHALFVGIPAAWAARAAARGERARNSLEYASQRGTT